MRLEAAVIAVVMVTAGCAGLGASGTGTSASTPAPATTTIGPCDTDYLLTDDGTEAVTPKPLPDRPSSFDAESVGRFAQAHERAFAHNHELGERVRGVSVELQGTTVKRLNDGFVVRIHVWTRASVGPASGATDGETTTTESHYDAHYFVSDSTLRRAETERHASLPDADLSQSGLTLACWDE